MSKRVDVHKPADIKVRLKEPLRMAIEAAAGDNAVSMNAEIVKRLERSFRDDEVLAAITRLERRVKRVSREH
jgi:hypothetical protein